MSFGNHSFALNKDAIIQNNVMLLYNDLMTLSIGDII